MIFKYNEEGKPEILYETGDEKYYQERFAVIMYCESVEIGDYRLERWSPYRYNNSANCHLKYCELSLGDEYSESVKQYFECRDETLKKNREKRCREIFDKAVEEGVFETEKEEVKPPIFYNKIKTLLNKIL